MKHLFLRILVLTNLILFSSYAFTFERCKQCSDDGNESIEAAEMLLSDRSKPVVISKEHIKSKRKYIKSLYTIEAVNQGEKQSTKFYYYAAKRGPKGPKPTVILFSSIGGITLLERYVAYYLARKGISTIVSELEGIEKVEKVEDVSPYFLSSLFSSVNILDFASNHPDIDADKIATIGISLGGFRALYLSAMDMRIKSATLVVSGLSVAETIATSDLELVQEIRGKQMKNLELDPMNQGDYKTYEEILHQNMMFDIKELLCRRNSSDFFLFQSTKDSTVPYKQQKDLFKALGKPKRKVRNHFGHVGTAVMFGLSGVDDATDFIKDHF